MADSTITAANNNTTIDDIPSGSRLRRKTLITVAEWGDDNTREILGARTEDSSIEFNPETETTTDILGVTYTDVEKTEPQQDFDPYYLLAGSELGTYLSNAALTNDIDKYNCAFSIYIITAYKSSGSGSSITYDCVKHEGCTILPTSLGGDDYISMPIEVHYSNKITKGTVDKLADDFTFTAATSS